MLGGYGQKWRGGGGSGGGGGGDIGCLGTLAVSPDLLAVHSNSLPFFGIEYVYLVVEMTCSYFVSNLLSPPPHIYPLPALATTTSLKYW